MPISSWDIPLIAWPNVVRPKIEGPINTCLAAATKPRGLQCTPMLTGPDNHRALQGTAGVSGDWKMEVHLQLREKFGANLMQ